jgi:hypothetical protein
MQIAKCKLLISVSNFYLLSSNFLSYCAPAVPRVADAGSAKAMYSPE